ncbi:phosphate/phosphite/phosphonate ABC transporter substrate-binding protein [Coralloluteibacterium thermophilus]|uniref:Phosphate/phosphite/phosphonate ABC transporter substrate-binding protein n=1 Tax=Coralloluteibacterium thermophilum TaxID=2707049 RepID=A0ABV9NGY8_9GAMM
MESPYAHRFASLLLLGLLASAGARAETYTIAVEPSYPEEQAAEVYRPLLDYLDRTTGHRFSLRTWPNYHVYWRDLRAGDAADFAFEEAHLADYRIQHHGFVPLVRAAGPGGYSLVAAPGRSGGLQGLHGARVVGMPSPSLGYVLLSGLYRNPVAQPDIQSLATTWREGIEMVFAGEAEAAMVPTRVAQEYPNLVVIHRSRDHPGAAFSAAPGVPESVRVAVSDALLVLQDDAADHAALAELGIVGFDPAAAADYSGAAALLSGVFGYRPPPAAAPPRSAGAAR